MPITNRLLFKSKAQADSNNMNFSIVSPETIFPNNQSIAINYSQQQLGLIQFWKSRMLKTVILPDVVTNQNKLLLSGNNCDTGKNDQSNGMSKSYL